MNKATKEQELTSKRPRNFKDLIAVISCVSIAGISMGFTLPLMTILLDRDGSSGSFIGLIGSMLGIAIVLFSPFVPTCISYLGMRKFVIICMLGETLMFVCLLLFPTPVSWVLIRFVMGMAVAGIFIGSESWINHLAISSHRGRILALFNISLGLGFASGPLLLVITGTDSWLPFISGACICFLATIPLLLAQDPEMDLKTPSSFNQFSFILIAPAYCAAVVLASGTETLMGTFFHYYGSRVGYAQPDMHVMLTLFFLGGLVFQYPIGWLADHINIPRLLLILGMICMLCIILTFQFSHMIFVFKFLLFCWGGILTSIYNTVLTAVGHEYKGADLIAANASFGFLWGIGGLMPLVGGQATQAYQGEALIYVSLALTMLFIILMVGTLINPKAKKKNYN
ncbi:MFS transporter [Kiloniella sp.]|uniref:MFS transporter n=1 Tax=Kiloniella sp. TaxID=1938587 RepID=UPI003A90A99E